MSAPTATPTTARNATLEDLAAILKDQQARTVDFVAPASKLRAKDGALIVKDTEAVLTEDGVTTTDGTYVPTTTADGGIADKLKVPSKWLTGLRAERGWMYDQVVNGMLHGKAVKRAGGELEVITPGDDRSFLLRTFRGDDGGPGILRAFLSDRFGIIDNLDILVATLQAVRDAGVEISVHSTDLTENRMFIRAHAPAVAALAPVLLGGYRNPFADPAIDAQRRFDGAGLDSVAPAREIERWRQIAAAEGMGYAPGAEPVVFAGFRISNSEVGGGAFSIAPELRVQVCRNGLVLNALAERSVHLGQRLDNGVVEWSEATQRKSLDLIVSKTRDVVKRFLSPEFLAAQVAGIEEKAGKPVESPEATVKALGKNLKFSQDEIDGVLGHFIRGGQMTAGGVLNAITSYSQTVPNADRANELDGVAMQALSMV